MASARTEMRAALATITRKWKLEILWCSIMGQSFVSHSGDRKIVSKIVFALSISLVRCMATSAMAMPLLWRGGDPHQELSSPSTGEREMSNFSPELIAIMRAALDDVMTHVPVEQATSAIKVLLAEFILKAAEKGHTSYDVLFVAAFSQIGTMLLMVA